MKTWLTALPLLVLNSIPAMATTHMPWSELIVFGDSLSDAGNSGPPATDGTPWANILGAAPSTTGGTNFAWQGATAQARELEDGRYDLLGQVDDFLASGVGLGDDPVAVIWIGGNDLLPDATAPLLLVETAIRAAIGLLSGKPLLDRILLLGLPDLATIPAFNSETAEVRADRSAQTAAFNAMLRAIDADEAGAKGLAIDYVDIDVLFSDVQDDPTAFGFSDITTTCGQGDAEACEGFLFWDPIHPTGATHALIANTVLAAAQPAPVPLPTTGWLLLAGLGVLTATSRRRRV